MLKNGMPAIHPGETLREDFLLPLGMSASALAKALHVGAPSVNEIVRERRGVSPLMALRLSRYFGGSAQWWINMQATYDLKVAEKASAKQIEREVKPRTPHAMA
ncbi:HigA family addiction module antitoxin [Variovorax sp. LT1R16]|uniref:HigA family addiction module antitoxin n=1 Tax=Variovorax sp. LT1R16 TaxID=3443728 RepID=UPI003F48CD15